MMYSYLILASIQFNSKYIIDQKIRLNLVTKKHLFYYKYFANLAQNKNKTFGLNDQKLRSV